MSSGARDVEAARRGGNRASLVSGLLTSVVTLLLVLGTFEIYLRATFEEVDVGECGIRDPELVWANKANCGESNASGFRDYDYSAQKMSNVIRVVFIGDSVVEGHRVGIAETFGKKLERSLNAEGDRSFEVIHLARRGYTMKQELVLLKQQAFQFDPDLIIWNYCLNDPLDPIYHPIGFRASRIGYRHGWFVPTVHVLSFFDRRLFLLKEKIRSRNCPREYHRFFHCAYEREIEAHIAEIADVSRERSIPILFVIHPIYHPGAYRNYLLTALHDRLKNIAEGQGLATYDLLDAYADRDVSEVGIINSRSGNPDVWHPSAAGHTVIAEYLHARLTSDRHIPR